MGGFVDIHCHLIPGVDDGAKDMDMSIKMMKMAYREGVRKMILTPHFSIKYRMPYKDVDEAFRQLVCKVKEEIPDLKLYLGEENYFSFDIPQLIAEGKAKTLNGTDYVLLEFSTERDFRYLEDGIRKVQEAGYIPILAHAERYGCLIGKIEYLKELIEMGTYIQMNADSIKEPWNRKQKVFIKKALTNRLVHFIATDAHDDKQRAPNIRACANYVADKYGLEYAKELFMVNGIQLLENKIIKR